MSQWGSILDVVDTAATGAVTGLNSTRGIFDLDKLRNQDLPHIFLWSGQEETRLLESWNVEERIYRVLMRLVLKKSSQESLNADMDAIRDAIHADHKLGGNVDWSYVEFREPHEEPQADLWIGDFVVFTRKFV